MNGIAVRGWQAPLVVESSDEMYGMILWGFLPCMDGRILPMECIRYAF